MADMATKAHLQSVTLRLLNHLAQFILIQILGLPKGK